MTPGKERYARLETLPNFEPGAVLSAQFIVHGKQDYHAEARYVQRLPCGRNANQSDHELLLAEGRATCSTKRAYKVDTHGRFVRELALKRELDFDEIGRIRQECILALSERHMK